MKRLDTLTQTFSLKGEGVSLSPLAPIGERARVRGGAK